MYRAIIACYYSDTPLGV